MKKFRIKEQKDFQWAINTCNESQFETIVR